MCHGHETGAHRKRGCTQSRSTRDLKAPGEGLDIDPSKTRCGCFLPDLTRLTERLPVPIPLLVSIAVRTPGRKPPAVACLPKPWQADAPMPKPGPRCSGQVTVRAWSRGRSGAFARARAVWPWHRGRFAAHHRFAARQHRERQKCQRQQCERAEPPCANTTG